MSFYFALRLTQLFLLFSVGLQAKENSKLLRTKENQWIQISISIFILALVFFPWPELWFGLFVLQIFSLRQAGGNLNGGSDAMTTISIFCVFLMQTQNELAQKIGFYYLSVQVILSYFVAGIVKVKEPDWRSGEALGKFLKEAFYRKHFPATFLQKENLLKPLSVLMLFWEITFPLLWFFPKFTFLYLVIGAVFHLTNALVFGIHRFFWTWLATYPIVLVFLTGRGL